MLGLCLLHTAVFSVPAFFYMNSQRAGQGEGREVGNGKKPLKANVYLMYLYTPVIFLFQLFLIFFFFSGDGNFVLAFYNLAVSPLCESGESGGKMGNAFLVISSCFC